MIAHPNLARADRAISRRHFVSVGLLGLPGVMLVTRDAGWAKTSATGIVVQDPGGTLAHTQAPCRVSLALPRSIGRAAAAGRLYLKEQQTDDSGSTVQIPVQRLGPASAENPTYCWLMSAGAKEQRAFVLEAAAQPAKLEMQIRQDSGGQFVIHEGGRPVLQYNYAKNEPGELLEKMADSNRKYAVARSDYIHPLYGPEGEVLTRDWPLEHPHHRGIYWAWPEVDWHGETGDLHALQRVFARPTGRCETMSGPVFAQLDAENLWYWEDRDPVVRERAIIRAYHSSSLGRLVDLELHFEALADSVRLARRGTSHYGGLNLRLNAVTNQQLTKFTDPAGANPRRCWSDLSGTFPRGAGRAGLTVIQHASNPAYPGDWIEYPELNWLQPTFPASGTRYELHKGEPLVLRFRLWIHGEEVFCEALASDQWQAANSQFSPLAAFTPSTFNRI